MDELSKALVKDFQYFNSNPEYYDNIIASLNCSEDELSDLARQVVIESINSSIAEGKIDWLINFLENNIKDKNSFNMIVSTISDYGIDITFSLFQDMLDKSPAFAKLMDQVLPSNKTYTDEEIEKKSKNQTDFDFLYTYATIKDIININLEDTDEEEVADEEEFDDYYSEDIAKMIAHQARKLQNYKKNPELFKQMHEYQLQLAITDDENARTKLEAKIKYLKDRIIEGNQMLIIKNVGNYLGRGLSFEDLWGYGNLGLMEALERYDVTRGNRFSTYATWWIRQAITRNICDHGTNKAYRIPVHAHEFHFKVFKATKELTFELMRNPTPEEIAERIGAPVNKVKEDIKTFLPDVSVDSKVGDDEDTEFVDFLTDGNDFEEDYITSHSNREDIMRYLSYISTREEQVLRIRFGYPDGKNPLYDEPHTLEETGKYLGVTRERVRQIEVKGLRRIRKIEKIKYVEDSSKFDSSDFWHNIPEDKRRLALENMRYLSIEDRELLIERYDSDYNGLNHLGKEKNKMATEALKKVVKMIQNVGYRPVYREKGKNGPLMTYQINPVTGEKELVKKSNFPFEGRDLIDMFGSDYMDKIAGSLEEHREYFVMAFGENLDQKANTIEMNDQDVKILRNAINELKPNRKAAKKKRTLYYLCKCNYIELMAALSKVDNQSWLEFLKGLFGDNYQGSIYVEDLAEEDNKLLTDICYNLNLKVKKTRSEIKRKQKQESMSVLYDGKKIHEIFNCSEELANYLIESRQSTKIGPLLIKQNNGEKFTKEEATIMYNFVGRTMPKIRKYQESLDLGESPRAPKKDKVSNKNTDNIKNESLITRLSKRYNCSVARMETILEGKTGYIEVLELLADGKEPSDANMNNYFEMKNFIRSQLKSSKKVVEMDKQKETTVAVEESKLVENVIASPSYSEEDIVNKLCLTFDGTVEEIKFAIKDIEKDSHDYELLVMLANNTEPPVDDISAFLSLKINIKIAINKYREKDIPMETPETENISKNKSRGAKDSSGGYTKYIGKSLGELFGCDEDRANEIVKLKPKNSEIYRIFMKIKNQESLTNKERRRADTEIWKIKHSDRLTTKVRKSKRQELLDSGKKQVGNEIISIDFIAEKLHADFNFTVDEMKRMLIGSRKLQLLNKVANGESITKEEEREYRNYRSSKKKKIPENKQVKAELPEAILEDIDYEQETEIFQKLCEYFGCTSAELKEALTHFSSHSKGYMLIKYIVVPAKLTSSEIYLLKNCKARIKEYIANNRKSVVGSNPISSVEVDTEEPVEILTPEPYEGPASPLTHPFFKELIKLFPLEYRHVTELKLGIYDGTMYDDATIAALYNTTVDDIKLRIAKGKMLFDRIMSEYQIAFDKDFPREAEDALKEAKLLREK